MNDFDALREYAEAERERANRVEAKLARVQALADKWQAVLDECKAADPRWILDQSVTTLETALRELRALLDEGES